MRARVYLDTNVFISAFESETLRGDAMLSVLDAIGSGEFTGITSQLTIAELLPKPFALKQDSLVELYMALLSGETALTLVPVDRSVLVSAARLRADHSCLREPDAIHLATATDERCDVMVSDDRRLPAAALAVLRPGPDTLSRLRQHLS